MDDCSDQISFLIARFWFGSVSCQSSAGLAACSTEFKIRLVMAYGANNMSSCFVLFCFPFTGSYVVNCSRKLFIVLIEKKRTMAGQAPVISYLLTSQIFTRFLIESCLPLNISSVVFFCFFFKLWPKQSRPFMSITYIELDRKFISYSFSCLRLHLDFIGIT